MAERIRISQVLPSFQRGDAIGNEVMGIRKILRSWGYRSDIYVEHLPSHYIRGVRSFAEYAGISTSSNILIYHHGIGSALTRYIRTLADKKILIYHNITPYEYFLGINDHLAYILKNGRKELTEMNKYIDLALGDSDYNRLELEEMGFKNTDVLPLIIDYSNYDLRPDAQVLKSFDDDYTNILFVGRISPNKCHEDILKVFYCYKRFVNQKSRLLIVGSASGSEIYEQMIHKLADELKLEDVVFTGPVDQKSLIAYYNVADVFVCMSEHEGFCVPLIESMYFGVPIIAYKAAAVPWTLGNTALTVSEKSYLDIAWLIDKVISDETLRNRVVGGQRERLKDFDLNHTKALLKRFIEEVS
jgi:glycosyltransferase involved in cell wall biosynthesis